MDEWNRDGSCAATSFPFWDVHSFMHSILVHDIQNVQGGSNMTGTICV
jgi:hypothetical protein